jgi:hypothetical protein
MVGMSPREFISSSTGIQIIGALPVLLDAVLVLLCCNGRRIVWLYERIRLVTFQNAIAGNCITAAMRLVVTSYFPKCHCWKLYNSNNEVGCNCLINSKSGVQTAQNTRCTCEKERYGCMAACRQIQ